MSRMNVSSQKVCEICGMEISDEWAKFCENLCDYHRFCHTHKDMYLSVKDSIIVVWDGTKFVVEK